MFSAKNDATSSSPVNEVPEEDKSSDDERVINRAESFYEDEDSDLSEDDSAKVNNCGKSIGGVLSNVLHTEVRHCCVYYIEYSDICMYDVCMYVCMYVCTMYVCVYDVCMYCMYVCMYVCVFVCMYLYTPCMNVMYVCKLLSIHEYVLLSGTKPVRRRGFRIRPRF